MYDDGEIPPVTGRPVSVAGIILLDLLVAAVVIVGAARGLVWILERLFA
jgi:hypothetical protein